MDVHRGHRVKEVLWVSIILFGRSFWPKKSTHHNEPQEHEHCCYAIHGVAEELLPIDDT